MRIGYLLSTMHRVYISCSPKYLLLAAKAAETMPPRIRPNVQHGLHKLYETFGLGPRPLGLYSHSEAVIVAVDFENTGSIKAGLCSTSGCQAGLAILDTKDLRRISPSKLISTYNFATGSPSYLTKVSKRFLFGESVAISPMDMPSRIKSLIPLSRNVLFVGHGIFNEILVLRALKFEFPQLHLGNMDTLDIGREVFGHSVGSLKNLLTKLGCPYDKLHCAGNDANFSLRALLLLLLKGYHRRRHEPIGKEDKKTLAILQQVVTQPVSNPTGAKIGTLKEQGDAMKRNLKHLPKIYGKEEQITISAA